MSKNALVLDDHYGDNGHVTAGMILHDVTVTRFNELEKNGLVREATAEEVKAGDRHSIEADPSKGGEGDLREDGPTISEFVDAGYPATGYPPAGYISRSTPEEIAAAIEAQQKDGKKPEDKKAADPKNKGA